MPKAVALLVAAGSGERLGASRPKAFVTLAGRPMVEWSVAAMRAAGLPEIVVALPEGEAAPPDDWRIVATAGRGGLRGSAPLVRRFAHVRVPAPAEADLHAAIDAAAGRDPVAAAAVKRLLGARDLGPLGAGTFLAAARFAAARNAAAAADEVTLAREALVAHVAPLLPGLDDEGRRRLAGLAG